MRPSGTPAEEVVRDYVERNFVDKGMCADWAIHDSENDKGQFKESIVHLDWNMLY